MTTRKQFAAIVAPLARALRTDMDAPSWTAYYRALGDVPPGVLAPVVDRLLREPLRFFPKAGELRAACEVHRRALLAEHPYEGCVDCEHSRGWCEIAIGTSGQTTVVPCPCRQRYREQLDALGLGGPLAQLPAAGADDDDEAEYPTVDQLPAALRDQLRGTSDRKAMR